MENINIWSQGYNSKNNQISHLDVISYLEDTIQSLSDKEIMNKEINDILMWKNPILEDSLNARKSAFENLQKSEKKELRKWRNFTQVNPEEIIVDYCDRLLNIIMDWAKNNWHNIH